MTKSKGEGCFDWSQFKSIGKEVIFEDGVRVFHPENISIGDRVYIGHDTVLEAYHKNEMVVGSNTWIGRGCFFHSAGGIRIGNDVGIGTNVQILTSVHREGSLSKPIIQSPLEFKEVIVEDWCDIGIGTIILPGIHIGRGVQVGAGSVVTKDVEPFMIIVGNPAHVLRKREETDNESMR
jgi:acetyltransferase-like isoleucine patch superfamily enzyme